MNLSKSTHECVRSMLGGKAGSLAMVQITVCIVPFMMPFMLTAVGVALPSLGHELVLRQRSHAGEGNTPQPPVRGESKGGVPCGIELTEHWGHPGDLFGWRGRWARDQRRSDRETAARQAGKHRLRILCPHLLHQEPVEIRSGRNVHEDRHPSGPVEEHDGMVRDGSSPGSHGHAGRRPPCLSSWP